MQKRHFSLDFRISLVYLLFGGLWILLSDRLLAALVTDPNWITRLQTYKGWGFVGLSTLVIFLLLRNELRLHRISESKLQEMHDRLASIVAATPGIVCSFRLKPDGSACFPFGGERIAETYGIAQGRLDEDAAPFFALVHPGDLEGLRESMAESARSLSAWRHEWRVRHPVRGEMWIEGHCVPRREPDGSTVWHGITSDITERKQAMAKLRLAEERFANAFRTSPVGMTITRIADGKFIEANEFFCRMFEFSRGEVIGHTSTELNMWTPEERKKLIDEQIRSGGLHNFELQARAKSGRVVNILFSSTPMEIGGEAHHLTTMIDITERKHAQEELRLHRDRLAELSRRLVEAHETAQRAIGRELHDQIGQMLTALKLTLEIAPQLPPELAARKMQGALELLDELTARVSSLSLELRPPMLDDFGLVPALVWHVNRYQDQTGITVDFKHSAVEGRRFAPEIETTAYRIIQEALTNVARHAHAACVRLEVRAESQWMEILMEDDGTGFDPQAALAKQRGLSAMRERVLLVGGEFHLESEKGKGTRKQIRLPVREKTL